MGRFIETNIPPYEYRLPTKEETGISDGYFNPYLRQIPGTEAIMLKRLARQQAPAPIYPGHTVIIKAPSTDTHGDPGVAYKVVDLGNGEQVLGIVGFDNGQDPSKMPLDTQIPLDKTSVLGVGGVLRNGRGQIVTRVVFYEEN